MEYVHAAMLLHKAGQDITEDNVEKVLEAAGAQPDESRVKALVAALDGVDIDEAVEKAAAAPAPAAPAATEGGGAEPEQAESGAEEEKEEEPEEEDEGPSQEEAAEGLGTLFE